MDEITKTAYRLLLNAIDEFYKRDAILAIRGGMEQACVFRIAYYFQTLVNKCKKLKDYHVDCEYNKHLDDKKINFKTGTFVRPDLILHIRGKQNNILVIEFKSKNNKNDNDRAKLEMFTKNNLYNYKLGIFIRLLNTKEDCVDNMVFYENGQQTQFNN